MAQAFVRLGQIGMGLGVIGTVINSALFNGKSNKLKLNLFAAN